MTDIETPGPIDRTTETPGSANKNTNQNQIQGDLPAVENLQGGQSPLITAGQHIFHVTMSQCYHIIMFPNPNVSTSQYSSIKNSSAPPSIDHASHNVSREQQFFDMDTAVSYRLVLGTNHYLIEYCIIIIIFTITDVSLATLGLAPDFHIQNAFFSTKRPPGNIFTFI